MFQQVMSKERVTVKVNNTAHYLRAEYLEGRLDFDLFLDGEWVGQGTNLLDAGKVIVFQAHSFTGWQTVAEALVNGTLSK